MAMAERVRRWAWAVMVLALAGCPSEPGDYETCGAACDACGLGYCVAGGGSGHCSDPERARCIIDAPDCDELRACVAGP